MDEVVFDRLTLVLSASSRRSLLATVGLALAGTLARPLLGDEAWAKGKGKPKHGQRNAKGKHHKHQHQHRHAAAAKAKRRHGADSGWGPCGDGSAKANNCRHDAQCCTGYCSQKQGACRCKTEGDPCTADRNCCMRVGQQMTCQQGSCQMPGVTTSPPPPPPASPPPPSVSPPPPPPSPPPPPPPPPEPCVPQCAATTPCGDDGCGGSCGSCHGTDTCVGGTCVCTPHCEGRRCGPDGCGGVCGTCEVGPLCSQTTCDEAAGRCVLAPIAGCCSSDAQCDDGDPCTRDTCRSATCQHEPAAAGTVCAAGVCDGAGQCAQCLRDGDCDDGNSCTANTCQHGICQHPAEPEGTACTRGGGDPGVCDSAGQCRQAPPACSGGMVTCGSDCFPECCPGANEACYSGPSGTENVGVCRTGTRQCRNDGTWGACHGDVTPSAETCDGLDNDCDGTIDNGNLCPSDAPSTCGFTGQCSGGTCQRYGTETICRPAACENGIQTFEAGCDGAGSCPAPRQQTCPNGVCHDSVSCGPCGHDHDCGNGRWCNGGMCEDTQPNGASCGTMTPQQCQSGYCVGGVCCGSACRASHTTATCGGGACSLICHFGFGDCNSTMSDGCEVNMLTDNNNCGSCGHVCATGTTCNQGLCRTPCQTANDCPTGQTCGSDKFCKGTGLACDCSNLNNCSGHGVCTDTCACHCQEPWTGPTCTDLPITGCSDYTTCGECMAHASTGCVYCNDADTPFCTVSSNCFLQEEVCP